MKYAALLLISLALPVQADSLKPIDPPKERPYPYEILGLQPGDPLDDLTALFTKRSQAKPSSESQIIRVRSPEGKSFEFTNEISRSIGSRGIYSDLNSTEVDKISSKLASVVLHKRPMSIIRQMRRPTEQLPEMLALKAQIEGLYGKPSQLSLDAKHMRMIYAWGKNGFIADIMAQPEQTLEIKSRHSTKRIKYRTCMSGLSAERFLVYKFERPRSRVINPGCVAIFTVTFGGKPGSRSISFRLIDFELARINQAEIDHQIIRALSSKEVEASDMDL